MQFKPTKYCKAIFCWYLAGISEQTFSVFSFMFYEAKKFVIFVVNGKYGVWSSYNSCSKSCGGGSQKRTRKCDSPAPAFGGANCDGPKEQSQSCNTQNCPGMTFHLIYTCPCVL